MLCGCELRNTELVQQIQQIRGNVIFSDPAPGNPKEMGFTELDCSMDRSYAEQLAGVGSAPGPSHGGTPIIVDHLVDVTFDHHEAPGEHVALFTNSVAPAGSMRRMAMSEPSRCE